MAAEKKKAEIVYQPCERRLRVQPKVLLSAEQHLQLLQTIPAPIAAVPAHGWAK